jgi:aminoglycoside phosphotransferase (APT) family kinase protein
MTSVAAIAAELGLRDPVVTELHGGLSNRSWRLRDAKQDLVLRQSGAGSGILGSDLRSELAMQEIAAAAGLAPSILLARPAEGLLVTRYMDGHVLSYDDVRVPAMLERIGSWFASLHSLAPPQGMAGIDLGVRAAGYLRTLRGRQPTVFLQELERGLAARRRSVLPPRQLAACHHDLHHLNLVDCGDALIALDWEYAGPGDPVADLAACIGYHDLDLQQIDTLLAGYGGDPRPLLARLVPLRWIFDCLWFGWMEIAAQQGVAVDAGRRQRLIDCLAR